MSVWPQVSVVLTFLFIDVLVDMVMFWHVALCFYVCVTSFYTPVKRQVVLC